MVNRVESKKPNVYKIAILDNLKYADIAYVSSIIKAERYIEEWSEIAFPNEVYEITMSKLKIQDEQRP